jgi:putative resolvase
MKLSAWAKANGLTYQTAWLRLRGRMWRNGKLPASAEQLPTGTVIVHPPKTPTVDSVAIYARVRAQTRKPTWSANLDALPNLLLGNG